MTDVYNPDTVIGTVQYPDWLLGGAYRSLFGELYDKEVSNGNGGRYYPNVAGTSSAFVCAEETIFSGKEPTDKNKDCIKQVFVAPVGSVGFAPWPWLGFYANFTRNLNLGISLKPFKEINWNISQLIWCLPSWASTVGWTNQLSTIAAAMIQAAFLLAEVVLGFGQAEKPPYAQAFSSYWPSQDRKLLLSAEL